MGEQMDRAVLILRINVNGRDIDLTTDVTNMDFITFAKLLEDLSQIKNIKYRIILRICESDRYEDHGLYNGSLN